MKTAFDTGLNRTGMATSPIRGPLMEEGAQEGLPSSPGNESDMSVVRVAYAREAKPIGSVPPPGTLKGLMKTAIKALQGEKAAVFVDKLGERLAFERTGTRLYELTLSKFDAYPSWEGGPMRQELVDIHRDELFHFALLQQAMEALGADPTAMTPSADLASVLSQGVPAVLSDPRTDLRQCLEGLLVAELTDNACWETLIALARELQQDEMVAEFQEALQTEERHLTQVKGWLRQGVMLAALVRPEIQEGPPPPAP